MTFKLLLVALLTAAGFGLSGCVVYDHDRYYHDRDDGYYRHHDRDYDRDYDRHHNDWDDYRHR